MVNEIEKLAAELMWEVTQMLTKDADFEEKHPRGEGGKFGEGGGGNKETIFVEPTDFNTLQVVGNRDSTAKSAAAEFARTWWQEPRKVMGFKQQSPFLATFTTSGGVKSYQISYDKKKEVWPVVALG